MVVGHLLAMLFGQRNRPAPPAAQLNLRAVVHHWAERRRLPADARHHRWRLGECERGDSVRGHPVRTVRCAHRVAVTAILRRHVVWPKERRLNYFFNTIKIVYEDEIYDCNSLTNAL